jgi:hypothetical protein
MPTARAKLIRVLANGDAAALAEGVQKYEVDGVLKLESSPESIPQDVRVLELLYPTGAFATPSGGHVRPLIETQQNFIAPLLRLVAQGRIPAPTFDTVPAHSLGTEVFVLAGRLDEAVDYRTSIALAYVYARSVLYIAGDNYSFRKLESAGLTSQLVQTFLENGMDSGPFRQALDTAARLQGHEK